MNKLTNLVVKPVKGIRQMAVFIRLPRIIYKSLSGYVPPLDIQQKKMLSPRKAPFFKYGRCCYFLAWKNGKAVGRISAQIDPVAIKQWGKPIGVFGTLDAIEDQEVVSALLEAAQKWLKAEGMTTIRGPFTLTPNAESGTMVSGQSAPLMTAMPWHPDWLAPMIEKSGFTKAMDLYSYQMEFGAKALSAHVVPTGLTLGQGSLGDITTRMLDMNNIARDGEILRTLYNHSWENNWGFVPLSALEMKALITDLKPLLKPEHFVLVEQKGQPVAVALVVPNIYDLTPDIDGAPTPLGWIKLVKRLFRHEFHSARVILLGVSDTLQGTALGAVMPALVISELMNRGRVLPYTMIELGWILETNLPMRRLIERLTPNPCKIYRIFENTLD